MGWSRHILAVFIGVVGGIIQLNLTPIHFLLNGISFNKIDKSALLKCTEAEIRTDNKNKKHKTTSSSAKPKYESITFQSASFTAKSYPLLPSYTLLRVFLGLAMACGLALLAAIGVGLSPLRAYAADFLPAAGLAFLGFTLIGIINTFSENSHRLRNTLLAASYGVIAFGVYRGLPTGPCDLSLLMPTPFSTRVFAATATFYLGCLYARSIGRLCAVYRHLENPRETLLKTNTYITFARRILSFRKRVLNFLLKGIPGNIFFFIVLRFFMPRLWDWVMDVGFVAVAFVVGIARLWLAWDCVQLLTITKSLQAMVALDDKRTQAAVRAVERAIGDSLEAICPNCIAFLVPGCVSIAMVLLYCVSWVLQGWERAAARIGALFVLCATDFLIAAVQLPFGD
jgi:hypothetical protein